MTKLMRKKDVVDQMAEAAGEHLEEKPKQVINFIQDKQGIISKIMREVMKDYPEFEILKALNPLYTFRVGKLKFDKDNAPIEGFAKKLSARERDIYEKDVEICVQYDFWSELTQEQKKRLAFRIMCSISIEVEGGEALEVVRDDADRVKFTVVPPDLVVRLYSREVREYGVNSETRTVLKLILPSANNNTVDEDAE